MEKTETRDGAEQSGLFNCWDDELVCVICMNAIIINLSVTDTCLHRFCFECLKRWSLKHSNCPLCRRQYANIRYNIRSKTEFNEISINRIRLESAETSSDESFISEHSSISTAQTLGFDLDSNINLNFPIDRITRDLSIQRTTNFNRLYTTYTSASSTSTSSPTTSLSSSSLSVCTTTTTPFSYDSIENINRSENIFGDSDPFGYPTHRFSDWRSLPPPQPNEIIDYFVQQSLLNANSLAIDYNRS